MKYRNHNKTRKHCASFEIRPCALKWNVNWCPISKWYKSLVRYFNSLSSIYTWRNFFAGKAWFKQKCSFKKKCMNENRKKVTANAFSWKKNILLNYDFKLFMSKIKIAKLVMHFTCRSNFLRLHSVWKK